MSFQLRGSLQAAGPMAAMSNDSTPVQYTFNSNIMVAAMVILFVVVFFVVGLHVYAKWFWRQRIPFADRQMAMSWRRRRRRHEDHEPFVLFDDTNIHGGLDKSIRDALPTFSYQSPMNVKEGAPLECAVCLSEFQQNEKGRLLPICKHSFHIDCIDMWFMSHSTCPLCRAAVVVIPTGKSRSMEASLSGNSSLVNGNHGHLEQGGELHVHTEVTQTTAEGGNSTPIGPSGVVPPPPHVMLVWNQHCLSYQLSSPCLGGHGSSSTRSLPSSSATDMVARCPDGSPIARCVSFSLSSATAAVGDDQGCSSSRPAISKSASARNPIKWLLRREMSKGKSRVYPSSRQGSVDLDQNSCPCTSSSLPV